MNAHRTTYDIFVTVEGGKWDGNMANQASGHGVDWLQGTNPTASSRLRFQHMNFWNIKEDVFHLVGGSSANLKVVIDDVYQNNIGGVGLYTLYVTDSKFSRLLPCQKMELRSSSCITLSQIYLNEGAFLYNLVDTLFSTIWLDTSGQIGLDCEKVRYCQFSNLQIRVIGDGSAVESAIILNHSSPSAGNDCVHNSFEQITIGRLGGSGSRVFTKAFYEADSDQDFNTFLGIDAYDTTEGIILNGANSHCNHSWNSTSWIN